MVSMETDSSHILTMEKTTSSPKPQGSELSYFVAVLFTNPANRAPGFHTGHTPGASLSAIGLKWESHEKNLP